MNDVYFTRAARARKIMGELSLYGAEIKGTHACGCVLWAPVKGGWRCLKCMPPLKMPDELRRKIIETM